MTMTTKKGTAMCPRIRALIINVMTNPETDGMTQNQLAGMVGVHERTLRNYLTPALWDEIRVLRLDVMSKSLEAVDKAIFAKAAKGDVQAAKLIYARWEEMKNKPESTSTLQSIEQIDDELSRIRNEIQRIEQGTSDAHEAEGTQPTA